MFRSITRWVTTTAVAATVAAVVAASLPTGTTPIAVGLLAGAAGGTAAGATSAGGVGRHDGDPGQSRVYQGYRAGACHSFRAWKGRSAPGLTRDLQPGTAIRSMDQVRNSSTNWTERSAGLSGISWPAPRSPLGCGVAFLLASLTNYPDGHVSLLPRSLFCSGPNRKLHVLSECG